jgi:hypothetical protein
MLIYYRPFLGIRATVKYGSDTTCNDPGFLVRKTRVPVPLR